MEDDNVYEVERIVDHRTESGVTLFRVHWLGYDDADDTWEPQKNLEGCQELVDDYCRVHGLGQDTRTIVYRKSPCDTDYPEDPGAKDDFQLLVEDSIGKDDSFVPIEFGKVHKDDNGVDCIEVKWENSKEFKSVPVSFIESFYKKELINAYFSMIYKRNSV